MYLSTVKNCDHKSSITEVETGSRYTVLCYLTSEHHIFFNYTCNEITQLRVLNTITCIHNVFRLLWDTNTGNYAIHSSQKHTRKLHLDTRLTTGDGIGKKN